MERGCREEGLPTSPLLPVAKPPPPDRNYEIVSFNVVAADSSITPVLVFSTFIAVCGSFCYGCAVGYSSPAESGIMEELGLSLSEYSVFGSIMTIGGMIGAITSGKIADLVGRRRTMLLAELFCTPGWLAIAFAKNAWWLDIGRLLIGLGVGLFTYVVPVYVAEIAPKNLRGRFTSANQMLTSCGFALSYSIGNIISWRTLAIIGAIPCSLQLVGLFFIPESPRWLAKCGRKDFEASLRRLRGKNADVSVEAVDIIEITETFQQNSEGSVLELFQRRYVYSIIVGVGLMFLQQLGGDSGMVYYSSTIFSEADFSTVFGTTALALILLIAAMVSLSLMDIYGRRTLLMVSSTGTCLFLCVVGLSFLLKEHGYLKEITPYMAFAGLLGYLAAFAIGMSGIPWVIMSEIFPVSVKASAGSLVALTNWSCSWLISYTFNFMLVWSPAGTFFFFAGVCCFTILFIWKLVPETKGRTLEEIQARIARIPEESL
ncbi:sugar transporter ESL1 [Manihot esculenta]|uniref:Uncharacterized protein n=2 Tax=Manihot esculenta TaxID=3983 RepID=A0ACB7HCM7_MANES|nr:sugar transporter ESL1 [Manihot esculenta]KAG8649694.1 hypothetical protein MANES_08G124200v8 [Manihot esculenta]OAY44119.1 hypothetical protein MANES_08G124200v8 [Manihot esculenta]